MLYTMSKEVKERLNGLVSKAVSDQKILKGSVKLLAKIKAKKGLGCEISLTALRAMRKDFEEYVFEFSDSESLTIAISQLYKNRKTAGAYSHLYKMADCYRLIIKCRNCREECFVMNEFCRSVCNGVLASEYTKEYGKALIIGNAIKKYGRAFCSKDF